MRQWILHAAAGRGSALGPVLLATLVLAGVLAGFIGLLDGPLAASGGHAALLFTTTGDRGVFRAILDLWRASGGMRALVAMQLALDALLFAALLPLAATCLRAVLRRRNRRGPMRAARWRRWRTLLGAAVAADLLLNAVEAFVVCRAAPTGLGWQPLLHCLGVARGLLVGAMLLALLVLAAGRVIAAGSTTLRREARRGLESIRDAAAYVWAHAVPLAMLAIGVGVLGALPQTREVLLGLRTSGPGSDGVLLLSLAGLFGWLVATAGSFKLLDGLQAGDRATPPPSRLRARHQLLLGISALLSTTQLLVTFIPSSTTVTAVVVASGSVTLWLIVMMGWEALFDVAELPRNDAGTLLKSSVAGWIYLAFLLGLAGWFWLPSPNEALARALGFFQRPDGVWRFNAGLVDLRGAVTLALAVLGTGLVLRNAAVGSSRARAGSRSRRRTIGLGVVLWLSVAFASTGLEMLLYQCVLVTGFASSVWLLARLAPQAAYAVWWNVMEARLKALVPALSSTWPSHGLRWLRGWVARQTKAPVRVFALLLVLLAMAGNVTRPAFAVQLGTLTIVFMGLAAWGLAYTWLFVYLPRRHGLGNWTLAPLLWALLVAPASSLSDGQAAAADPSLVQHEDLPTLHDHFRAWRRGLPDEASPVFVVAAAGGGLRAAYWTATLLAEMDDRTCGQFGRHVLALSGVSGGSVGAALYAAQRRVWERKALPQRCEAGRAKEMRAVLRNDYLSPVVASLIFADLPQSLVPIRYRTTDRNQALSQAFVDVWSQVFPHEADHLLGLPMAKSVPALRAAAGAVAASEPIASHPVLYLNATGVETGRRVIASNVALDGIPADPLFLGTHVSRGTRLLTADTSLIEAALDSARFPGLSPPGPVWRCSASGDPASGHGCGEGPARLPRDTWVHVVDGGFFENSGLETIKDALAVLRAPGTLSVHGTLPPIFLVAISNDKGTKRLCSGPDRPTPRLQGDGLGQRAIDPTTALGRRPGSASVDEPPGSSNGPFSALDALLSVRDARARLELQRSVDEFTCPFVVEWSLGDFLSSASPEPALGWMLSARSFDLMDAAVTEYARAFPFDQRACPPQGTEPRAFIGGSKDEARRCPSQEGRRATTLAPFAASPTR